MSLDYHLVDPMGDDEKNEQQSDVLDGCLPGGFWEIDLQAILGSIGHIVRGDSCGSEVLKTHLFLPPVLATNPTLHD
jgi:hypothetical protein